MYPDISGPLGCVLAVYQLILFGSPYFFLKGNLMIRLILAVSAWVLTATSTSISAGDRLSAEELRALLVGNTEVGTYKDAGNDIPYAEYIRADGVITGKDLFNRYTGTYTIRDEGCYYGDYQGTAYDGCYYFEKLPDGRYRTHGPGGKENVVRILPGDAKGLNEY